MRLGPGEDVGDRLLAELDAGGAGGAAVVAAVGSLAHLVYAVASSHPEHLVTYRERQRVEGAIEVGVLQGHLGRDQSGSPGHHLHGVFALSDGRVIGGHLFQATVLATLEVTLLFASDVEWEIRPWTPPGGSQPVPGYRAFVPRPRPR